MRIESVLPVAHFCLVCQCLPDLDAGGQAIRRGHEAVDRSASAIGVQEPGGGEGEAAIELLRGGEVPGWHVQQLYQGVKPIVSQVGSRGHQCANQHYTVFLRESCVLAVVHCDLATFRWYACPDWGGRGAAIPQVAIGLAEGGVDPG